jgi:RNA polymerase sigma factor (sigma-70 family)
VFDNVEGAPGSDPAVRRTCLCRLTMNDERPQDNLQRWLLGLESDAEQAQKDFVLLRQKLVYFFRTRGHDSPEDLANEVFARLMRRVSEGYDLHGNITAYCFGLARNISRESYLQRREFESMAYAVALETTEDAALQKIMMEEALSRLSPVDRDLLLAYTADPQAASKTAGLSANALRVRVFKIRQKLREALSLPGVDRGPHGTS